jgi:sulfur relay (sulfurtransferase) DsrC/TusE family protein
MKPWVGWSWSTTVAERHSRLTWQDWQDWQEKQRHQIAAAQTAETFTDREEALLRFLRWCYTERRLAS